MIVQAEFYLRQIEEWREERLEAERVGDYVMMQIADREIANYRKMLGEADDAAA